MHANLTRRAAIQWSGAAFALPVVQSQPTYLENGLMPFTPKFVDLVRNFTTVQGFGPVTLGAAVSGYTSLAAALSPGDQFYYCIQSVDRPQEREVGRGTMQTDGRIAREAVQGELTQFTSGTKTIALVTAAEWFTQASAGASIEAADRAALAAAASTRGPVMLTERGREGLFAWDPADRSAKVALDTQQGLHVAPATDSTGASGAWVRRFDGPVNPLWFGLLEGNAGGGNGAANSAALRAMLATLRARAANLVTFYQGVETIRFPTGYYEFAETIDLTEGTFIFQGSTTGLAWGQATQLKFPAGVTGIRTQHHNTSGANATDGVTHRSGAASVIRGLYLLGAYDGTEGEAHGIHLRSRAIVENCIIAGFEGDGIFADSTGGGAGNEGNTNNSQIDTCRIQECRNGIYVNGGDANIWTIIGVDVSDNRQWGVWDSSFLGNTYVGCHSANNGVSSGGSPSACVSHGGNRYGVVVGQEAGASTNAPSGTTTDNTWWYYIDAGGVHSNFPAWSSGTTYRSGGAYQTDGANAANVFTGCYSESGQGKAQLISPTLVVGGVMTRYLRGTAGVISSGVGGYLEASLFRSVGTFRAEGSSIFGTTTGANLAITFDNGASSNTLTFRSTSGSTQTDGVLITSRNQGMILRGFGAAGGQGNISFQSGTTSIAQVTPSGLNVFNGFAYRLNNVQVVGARKTGWALDDGTAKRTANSTYAAGSTLTFGAAYDQAEHTDLAMRLAAVETALQDATQTIKALKDDLHGNAGHGLIGT